MLTPPSPHKRQQYLCHWLPVFLSHLYLRLYWRTHFLEKSDYKSISATTKTKCTEKKSSWYTVQFPESKRKWEDLKPQFELQRPLHNVQELGSLFFKSCLFVLLPLVVFYRTLSYRHRLLSSDNIFSESLYVHDLCA